MYVSITLIYREYKYIHILFIQVTILKNVRTCLYVLNYITFRLLYFLHFVKYTFISWDTP